MNILPIIAAGGMAGFFFIPFMLGFVGMCVTGKQWLKNRKSRPISAKEDANDFRISLIAFVIGGFACTLIVWGTINNFQGELDCIVKGYTYQDGVCYSELVRAN